MVPLDGPRRSPAEALATSGVETRRRVNPFAPRACGRARAMKRPVRTSAFSIIGMGSWEGEAL